MKRLSSSINDITAPISRTHRRKYRTIDRNILVFAFVLISLIVFTLALLKTRNSSAVKGTFPEEDKSLRQTKTTIQDGGNEGILIHTDLGTIQIYFTPNLSGQTSVDYIQSVVADVKTTEKNSCDRCNLYRAEPGLLLQGVLSQRNVKSKVTLGPCPLDDWKPTAPCPPHDPMCGCHGPIMTRGMVGWAGGGGGPDFFINTHREAVDWWEHQYTVWGQVRDEESMELIDKIYKLPARGVGMRMLDEEIKFLIELF